MYLSLSLYIYTHMYVCMRVCMYIYIYIYIYTYTPYIHAYVFGSSEARPDPVLLRPELRHAAQLRDQHHARRSN